MSVKDLRRVMRTGAVCVGSMLLAAGCIDSDYDLNKVDLTMGLGSEGLGVRLGQTERIFLDQILDVDETVRLDGNNLYYFVKSGRTDFDINIDRVTTGFDRTEISTERLEVLSYEEAKAQAEAAGIPTAAQQFTVPADFCPEGEAWGSDDVKFSVEVDPEVAGVKGLKVEKTVISMDLVERKSRPDIHFGLDEIKSFEVTIPSFFKGVKILSPGWEKTETAEGLVLRLARPLKYTTAEICRVEVDSVAFDEMLVPKNGRLDLSGGLSGAKFGGAVSFRTTQGFTLQEGDVTDVQLVLHLGDKTDIAVEKVTGKFAPVITPDVDPIKVTGELPDFLTDDDVTVRTAGTTIKFAAVLNDISIGVNIGAGLTSVKTGATGFSRTVELQQVPAEAGTTTTIYYHEGETPYDPAGAEGKAVLRKVDGLGVLVEKLPDEVRVNLKDNHIQVQDRVFTVAPGRTYPVHADYDVFVPFEFAKGFMIVYNDSTNSFGDDLEDYAADGIRLSATIGNTIPLNLEATVVALDAAGNEMSGVTFGVVDVKAGTGDLDSPVTSEVNIDGTLADPYLLGKIDRLKFKVKSAADESDRTHRLYSTQYLEVKDIRLRLKGQVVADFN